MTPRTVPVDAEVSVTCNGVLTHRCPFVDEVDRGRIELTWTAHTQTIELHSLRTYLTSFADTVVSHEHLTDQIRRDLTALDGLTVETVRTKWQTAGMEVTCSTSPTPEQEQ